VAEVYLVAVEGEDLLLRVAFLELDGDDRFLDLALPRLLEADRCGKQVARELLLRPRRLPARSVLEQRQRNARDAQPEMPKELSSSEPDGPAQRRSDRS
jgi:hypothetical protein